MLRRTISNRLLLPTPRTKPFPLCRSSGNISNTPPSVTVSTAKMTDFFKRVRTAHTRYRAGNESVF